MARTSRALATANDAMREALLLIWSSQKMTPRFSGPSFFDDPSMQYRSSLVSTLPSAKALDQEHRRAGQECDTASCHARIDLWNGDISWGRPVHGQNQQTASNAEWCDARSFATHYNFSSTGRPQGLHGRVFYCDPVTPNPSAIGLPLPAPKSLDENQRRAGKECNTTACRAGVDLRHLSDCRGRPVHGENQQTASDAQRSDTQRSLSHLIPP
jgi:hypothetical protein